MNSPVMNRREEDIKKNKTAGCLPKTAIADYQWYLRILNEKVWKGLTPHDLYSLQGITKAKLYSLILKELGLTERSSREEMEEGLKQLQFIYQHSVHELQHTFLLPVPEGRKDMKWGSISAFVDTMYDTLNDPKCSYDTIVQCALFKTMYAVKDVLDHHGDLSQAGRETTVVLDRVKKMPWFTVVKEDNASHDLYFTNGLSKEDPEYIEGRINFRTKQFKSILMKLVYNRAYMTSDLLKDLIGIRVEIDDPRGTHMGDRALKYFAEHLFYSCHLEEKWSFLSSDFTSDIPAWKKKMGKKGTGNLREAKLVGDINNTENKKTNHSTEKVTNVIEVQFVYTGNKNESGFNKHEIYDLKKILSAACRLMGTLTVGNIRVAVRETLQLLENNKKIEDKRLSHLNEQSILIHLLYSKEEHGFLMPIRINGDLRFLTKDIYTENFHALYRDYPQFETLDELEFFGIYGPINGSSVHYVRDPIVVSHPQSPEISLHSRS